MDFWILCGGIRKQKNTLSLCSLIVCNWVCRSTMLLKEPRVGCALTVRTGSALLHLSKLLTRYQR